MSKIAWSSYQQNFFNEVKVGKGHIILEAVAGSGKTTALVEGFRHVLRGKKSIALAFNKSIQTELRDRAPSYIQDVLTFHSLGLRSIRQRFKNVVIDDYKVFNIIKEMDECDNQFDLMYSICDVVAFCKYELVDTPNAIDQIMCRFGIDVGEMDREQFIKIVIKTLAIDKTMTDRIDFDDMCWFPFAHNLFMGHYDYVFVDEFQDLNKSQAMMAQRVCRPDGGRIILAGDPKQNLYASFRGTDTMVIKSIRQHPETRTLTLPISYRCPKQIVEIVKPWVSNIEAASNAKEGEIKEISLNEMYKTIKGGCFILSRVNAPLIKVCMTLIRNGQKANIRGKDIGKQLMGLIKKSKKKQITAFLKWLDKWKDEEVAKLQEKGYNPENVIDRWECLTTLCEEFSSLEEVKEKIADLFEDTDEKNMIILSSVHKAKGLEREVVYLLKWTFRMWFDDLAELKEYGDDENEEANIVYVAGTRSRDKLYLVSKI